jgi:hypothetical protein
MTTLTIDKPKTNAVPALQYAGRLKLTDEQRAALRKSFNEKLNAGSPETAGRGGIRVAHAHITDVEAELMMDKITFASLIGSRESISLPVCLRLQRVLQVELVTEGSLKSAFDSYLNHLRENYW